MSASRPPVRRLVELDRLLRDGPGTDLSDLALRFEVAPRTVYRDLAFLRDQLGAPVVCDKDTGAYRYGRPSYVLPMLQFSEGELLALYVAERVVQQYRGTPYADELARTFDKLAAYLPDQVRLTGNQLRQALSVRVSAPAPADLEIHKAIQSAVLARRRLRVRYQGPKDKSARVRVLDPYHLSHTDGRWYVLAYAHDRKAVRTFALDRFLSVEKTDRTFDVPADFDPHEYTRAAFKARAGGRTYRVRLEFDRKAAPYVKGRQWHESQKLSETEDGRVLLEVTVAGLEEIRSWILSWGARVTVRAPEALRKMVVREAGECVRNNT